MSGCVFVGPTLSPRQAARGSLTVLPPAAVGDIYRATGSGYRAMLLIDGYFQSVPSVRHKEILFALDRGVDVFGCSSMGALRAAELAEYGMIGIGEIFRSYRDGRYTDDDEVAVAHADADADYRSLSVPMVTIRRAVTLAVSENVLSEHTAAKLVPLAKSLFYADRHWATVCEIGQRANLPAEELHEWLRFVRARQPDAKRDDAIEALDLLSQAHGTPRTTKPPRFEHTYNWMRLIQLETPAPPG